MDIGEVDTVAIPEEFSEEEERLACGGDSCSLGVELVQVSGVGVGNFVVL